MLDALVTWINPQAFVREVVIGLFLAIVGGFAYARAEKQWERLTGYVSSRTKKSRERRDRTVQFYESNPQLLPLHIAQISHYQFMVLFTSVVLVWITFANHFVGTGRKVLTPDAIASFHIWLGVATCFVACFSVVYIYSLLQAQAVSIAIERKAHTNAQKEPESA